VTPSTTPPIEEVTIGSQTWMRRNLRVTTDRFGNPIEQKTFVQINKNLLTAAYTIPTTSGYVAQDYGYFYNVIAITGTTLCPTGYHMPSETELTTLVTSAGGSTVAGKLKQSGLTYWNSPNTGAETFGNFDLRGSGYINGNSTSTGFHDRFKINGYLFTNTVALNNNIKYYPFSNTSSGSTINDSLGDYFYAHTVRCIKD
jgi:uncharacterized protein (TIGR02145 family)